MQIRVVTACLTSVVVVAAIPAAAIACTFCNNFGSNPLALAHPKAIEVAVATRKAIDNGLLASGSGALRKASGPLLVEEWAARLDRQGLENPGIAVRFVFIDSEQICGILVRGGRVLFDPQPSFHADSQVVTTRPAFEALLSNRLSTPEAQRLGLVLIEGDFQGAAVIPGQQKHN